MLPDSLESGFLYAYHKKNIPQGGLWTDRNYIRICGKETGGQACIYQIII